MSFNFSLLFRVAYRTVFNTRGTHMRLTPKRIFSLLVISFIYCIIEAANWIGFLLDDILFPGYRRQQIRQPVFIIGPPRSGTTYLQRILAADETHFSSMKTWEILFAPSVTQKKIIKAFGQLDSLFGSPLYRLARAIDKRLYKKLSSIHPASLFEAEEDGMILLHIFSSATAFFVLPCTKDLWPYFLFDQELDAMHRARIMAFYKRCVQNHLYVFGADKQFLSKNPMFSTMIESLNGTFPDAKFVYMARTPLETVPSTASLMSYYFNCVMNPLEPHPFLEEQMEILLHYYTYPLTKFSALPPERHQIILYTSLIEQPAQTVFDLCSRFGFELPAVYAQQLHDKKGTAQQFKRSHDYSLEKFGLTRNAIIKKYEAVFDHFGFSKTA